MNFKLFWRKTNRGLWLGAALLFALVLFIIISEVRFGFQKKEIRATAKEYAEALLSVNLVEGELGEDGFLTEAQKAAQKEKLDQIAKTYWYTGSVDLNSRNYDLATLVELLNKWQNATPGKVTAASYQSADWEITITRDGPGRVLVALITDRIEVRGEGADVKEGTEEGILFPTQAVGRALPGEKDSGEWSATCTVSFSLEMVRRGGKWQIAGMNASTGSGYYYGYGLLGMLE